MRLLGCTAVPLVDFRHRFFPGVYITLQTIPHALRYLIQTGLTFDIVRRLAKYSYGLFAHYSTYPVFTPAYRIRIQLFGIIYSKLLISLFFPCSILEARPP
jgi:hypothetical protein